MKKALLATVVTMTSVLCVPVVQAGNSDHGHHSKYSHGHYSKKHSKHSNGYRRNNRHHNKKGAVISYEIDAVSCDVTVSSTRKLDKLVLKDSSGKKVKQWKRLRSNSFDNFGMYSALLTEGSLYVGSGKRHEIGDDFREELASCLDDTPALVECPADVKGEIDRVLATIPVRDLYIWALGGYTGLYPPVVDQVDRCEIYGATNADQVSIYNGNSAANGFNVGVSFALPDSTTQQIDLSLEEADACVLHMSVCIQYDNLLP